MTALAAQHTTHPASCPHLAGQCTSTGDHDFHWGPENTIAAIRPDRASGNFASALLSSNEDGSAESEPRLCVSFYHFDGDLTLPELDQLIAEMRDFHARLIVQAEQLAAAQRQWEAQR